MTARAKKVTERAGNQAAASVDIPVGQTRAFVGALERLGYHTEPLLAKAGVSRADFDDPDSRIPCAAIGALPAAAM